MKKEKLLALINEEQKEAKDNKSFHLKDGDKYNFVKYFDGQIELLRKLKRKINKL